MDSAMQTVAMVVPPLLIFAMRTKWLAFLLGVLWVWGMMVVGAYYHLADPTYNSFAPAMSVLLGWLFGATYCAPWLLMALVIRWIIRRVNRKRVTC